VPLVATIHSGDRDAIRFVIKAQNRLAYMRADRVVCVSESIRERLIRKEFAPARKLTTISNGIVPPRRPDEAQAAMLRAELRLGPDDIVAACVGRLVPVKNHLRFLEAFAKARQGAANLVLIMAGDGPLRDETAAKVRALGLESSVRLLGTRKDVGHLLAIADIFALPSLNEGHSISLLEACSFAKAILASNRGGNPSIVTQGKSGVLVEPDDIGNMAEALLRLAKDPGLRASLGAEAQSVYREKFSMSRCMGEYVRLYAGLSPAFLRAQGNQV
jgi:glycosyltransferase involved in cell wall biosynthesis